jgi:hypothetical protein
MAEAYMSSTVIISGSTTEDLYREYNNGNTWDPNPKIKSWGRNTLKWKDSVDTGFFEPNDYRVNPYSVGSYRSVKDMLSLTYENSALGTATDYVSVQGNPFGYYSVYFIDSYGTWNDPYHAKLALQRAYGNVNAALLGLGTELGELSETLTMLRHPFKSLRDFLNYKNWPSEKWHLFNFLATGNYKGRSGKRAIAAATSTWMEIRYGLRPLLYTIEEVMTLVREGIKPVEDKIYNARSSSSGVVDRKTRSSITAVAHTYTSIRADFNCEVQFRANASVQYRYKDLPSVLEKYGLSAQHFPEIAWELTRLSFVVDWFYGIGPWISALRRSPSVEYLGNTLGKKVTMKVTISNPSYKYYYDPTWYPIESSACDIRKDTYTRVIDESLAGPQSFSTDFLDYLKSVDLLIILLQNIKF